MKNKTTSKAMNHQVIVYVLTAVSFTIHFYTASNWMDDLVLKDYSTENFCYINSLCSNSGLENFLAFSVFLNMLLKRAITVYVGPKKKNDFSGTTVWNKVYFWGMGRFRSPTTAAASWAEDNIKDIMCLNATSKWMDTDFHTREDIKCRLIRTEEIAPK